MNLHEIEAHPKYPYQYCGSLTEQQAALWNDPSTCPKIEQPEVSCVEEALWRGAFLLDIERKARKRYRLLTRLALAELDHIKEVEAQRLRLERGLVPVKIVKPHQFKEKPKAVSKDDLIERWRRLSAEELDQLLADLGEMEG